MISKEEVIAALSRHFRSPEAVRARNVGGLDYLVIDVVKGSPLIFGFVLGDGEGPLPPWSYCCNAVFAGNLLTLSQAVARTAVQEVLSPAGHQDWVARAQAAPEGCVAVDGTGTAWQKDLDGPLWRRIGSLSGCWYSLDEDADYIASTFGPLRLIGAIA